MKETVKETAKHILDSYLEQNNRRKTPERYAILEAIYDIDGSFTIDELSRKMADSHLIQTSRATLYNTINLLLTLRLVAAHRIMQQTRYEACYSNEGQCRQVCTMCGKEVEVQTAALGKAVKAVRCRRFKKEAFSLYIYGICSSCQAKMTRERTNRETRKNKNRQKNESR